MVRTKADGGGRKAVAAKAPRKALAPSPGASTSMGSPSGKGDKYGGGNPACPRPTPDWQKGIGGFLVKKQVNENASPNKENFEENNHKEDGEGGSKQVAQDDEC